MRTKPGWHGYWLNPGDAGLPMSVEWSFPPGWSVGPLRYPGAAQTAGRRESSIMSTSAIMRSCAAVGARRRDRVARRSRAKMRWLACTDKICVPEQGECRSTVPTSGTATPDARFNDWRRALPRPLGEPAHFALKGENAPPRHPAPCQRRRSASPISSPPKTARSTMPRRRFIRRNGDLLIAELKRRAAIRPRSAASSRSATGAGWRFARFPARSRAAVSA